MAIRCFWARVKYRENYNKIIYIYDVMKEHLGKRHRESRKAKMVGGSGINWEK